MRGEFLTLSLLSTVVAWTTNWGANPPSSTNCTWKYFNQSLDHFAPGVTSGHGATFMQRYCYYDTFWTEKSGPIFFYTGNESPVEVYVNNTGLMWDLAKEIGALIIFAEHRYEGESVPSLVGMDNCLAFCTSAQALADYATMIHTLKAELQTKSAVIAFGGSYGGMLTAWMRFKYPNIIAGGIAASAPIWGTAHAQEIVLPTLDGASVAISRGASKEGGAAPLCHDNLLAFWTLATDIGKTSEGRDFLSKNFNLCTPLKTNDDVAALLTYAQSVWFLLSEGNYPFPSTYITFSVGPGLYPLPAWPMRVACDNLKSDCGVSFEGDVSDVEYEVSIGPDVKVKVSWDQTQGSAYTFDQVRKSGFANLTRGVRDAVAVWYNVTGKLQCFDWTNPVESEKLSGGKKISRTSSSPSSLSSSMLAPSLSSAGGEAHPTKTQSTLSASVANVTCVGSVAANYRGSWGPVCCNEDLNLINTVVQGVGRDFFWPPNVPRNYTVASVVASFSTVGCEASYEPLGLFGLPARADPWGGWIDIEYGGLDIQSATNLVYSNGLLDPWWSGGVLTNLTGSFAVELPLGAHHLDLFFATDMDPPDAQAVRAFEKEQILRWISESR